MSGARIDLCALADLDGSGSRGFSIAIGGRTLELFVVRHAEKVHAYRNRCPHLGATLEWLPNRFLSADGEFIQCGLHGALFLIETGECVRGPCLGDRLDRLQLRVDGGRVTFILEKP